MSLHVLYLPIGEKRGLQPKSGCSFFINYILWLELHYSWDISTAMSILLFQHFLSRVLNYSQWKRYERQLESLHIQLKDKGSLEKRYQESLRALGCTSFFLLSLSQILTTWRITLISVQTLCGRTAQKPSWLLNVTMAVCHQSIWNPSHNYQTSQSINGVSNTLDSYKDMQMYWSGSSVWPIDCVYLHMFASMLHGFIFKAFMSIVSFRCISYSVIIYIIIFTPYFFIVVVYWLSRVKFP